MSGVIEWYYDNELKARRGYKDRVDRKEIMKRVVDSVGVSNRYKMYFIVRPTITLQDVMNEKSQLKT